MSAERATCPDEIGTERGSESQEEVSEPDTWQPKRALMAGAEADGHSEGGCRNGGRRRGNNAAEIGVGIGLGIRTHGGGGGGGGGRESELTDGRHDDAAVGISVQQVKDGRSSLKERISIAADGQEGELSGNCQRQCHVADDRRDLKEKIAVADDGGADNGQEDELSGNSQRQCHVADDFRDLKENIAVAGDGGTDNGQGGELSGKSQRQCHVADDLRDLKEKIAVAGDGGAADDQEGELPGDAQLQCHVADDRSRKEMALAGDGGGADGRQGCLPNAKLLTLVIVEKNGRLLLGRKKRGFGEGYYNGFGGKVEDGENIRESAARELEEEALIKPLDMNRRGILIFHFDDKPLPWEVHVFHVADYEGVPGETEEMAPEWFEKDDIPFEKMWADDRFWYPEFLNGRKFWGEFYFRNTHILEHHKLDTF
ncbi:hypothetical protein CBR_g23462 [Chara braunii]|uniref:Oxidized purine nucleoside triphosphate hydrolase n=1 Tax=Chara braunii TaxID=69332 RepID=A0A388L4A4_CHABU|nr:hypothetical protein CBR_g23462 [Chara braunii]|eukprot:GBG77136.1 hypothetical protein CBR_g23462 [Chara braunii]